MKLSTGLGYVVLLAIAGGFLSGGRGGQLPTGKNIAPAGNAVDIGSFPCNVALSPDRRFVAVTNAGDHQALTILDAATGKIVDQCQARGEDRLYYGLAWAKGEGGAQMLYASLGKSNKVEVVAVGPDGKFGEVAVEEIPEGPGGSADYVAGIAVSDDGKTLYAALNECYATTDFRGAVAVVDLVTQKVVRKISTPGFPLAIACAGSKLYVTCEMGDCVAVLSPDKDEPLSTIKVPSRPVGLTLDASRSTLYVACANADALVAISTAQDKIMRRLLLRPTEFRGLPGCTPLGATLSSDEKTIYVPMADWNAVAVVDSKKFRVTGYVPVGWYPTAVAATNDRLIVANAKGTLPRVPNGSDVGGHGTYILNVMEGTVSSIDLAEVDKNAEDMTEATLALNGVSSANAVGAQAFENPGIKYVIYVIKENRTFDQLLGDIPQGDVDPKLCLFGEAVTPNQHVLASRFGLYDNFFVCAEVSADGWNWSVGGMANEYTSRNSVTSYTGGGRDYDFEGQMNGAPVDLMGKVNPAAPAGGYIWDQCRAHGVSYRNYGWYLAFGDTNEKDAAGKPLAKKNEPVMKALQGHSCVDFRQFDMAFADSDAWVKLGLSPAPKQAKAYGSHDDPSRFATWKREYDAFLKSGKMPRFMMVRLPRDHTAGTAAGLNSPAAMVADNDYAVGQLVEAVTHGPLWRQTAIFILEDDAQAGTDHVDAHRSLVQVISPYSVAGLNSEFHNTDSVLRTIELILGLSPMTQYDAIATPFAFSSKASNLAPYDAIMPDRDVLAGVNTPTAYRAKDSARLVGRFRETDEGDIALNDILWHAVKGAHEPLPRTPGLIAR